MLKPPEGMQLEVWGDPIAHSQSPALHTAAYRVLGLDWSYGRRRVAAEAFATELAALPPSFRGLSLTMPLKEAAFRAAGHRDRRAELTGAVNTLLFTPDGPSGINTDIGGIVRSLREAGVTDARTARLIGTGATAASALIALGEIGVHRIEVIGRRPAAIASLTRLGGEVGTMVSANGFGEARSGTVDLTIGTLPGGTVLAPEVTDALVDDGVLLDVAYNPWPSALAAAWIDAGGRAISGLAMLLHQALLQVRFFVSGDVETELPDEERVLAQMRAAIGAAESGERNGSVPPVGD